MSKPKIYRRRRRHAMPAAPVYVIPSSEVEDRYGVRPFSDKALGCIGVVLVVLALVSFAGMIWMEWPA